MHLEIRRAAHGILIDRRRIGHVGFIAGDVVQRQRFGEDIHCLRDADIGRFVEGAMDGAKRAADLTQRLLAFSRQQPLEPKPLNVNKMVTGMRELLGPNPGRDYQRRDRIVGREGRSADASPWS